MWEQHGVGRWEQIQWMSSSETSQEVGMMDQLLGWGWKSEKCKLKMYTSKQTTAKKSEAFLIR